MKEKLKIAIASGKGGTGKTTLSTNLAAFLAEQQQDVNLVDLDVEEPNSGLFFQAKLINEENTFKMVPDWIEDKCTLCGICQRVCNFHAVIQLSKLVMVLPELCHSCYACSELCPTQALQMIPKKMGNLKEFESSNFHFIESRLDIGEEQAVPLISQTKKYIHKKENKPQITIYDSPPGTSCPVIEATKDADFVILVTEPTPFGLHDLRLAVETMYSLRKPFGIVINRDGIGNSDLEEYCSRENLPVIARIPNQRRIAELYSKGELIYKQVPEVKSALKNIIAHIQSIN